MKSKKSSWLESLQRAATSTTVVIGAIVILRTFVIDWSVVPSGSMSHTFLTGDVVINNKMAYRYDLCSIPIIGVYFIKKKILEPGNIKRGDIIIFCGKSDYITKRVVALPGDIVTWDHVDLKINGESTMFKSDGSPVYPKINDYTLTRSHHDLNIDEVMEERNSRIHTNDGKYLKLTTLHSRKQEPLSPITYRVPEGHVFIVGDNRFPEYSWDSRDHYFGDVPISYITGKAVYRLFGSNAKVFNRKRSWVQTIIMLPYLVLRYVMSIDLTRFGPIYRDYEHHDNNQPSVQKS